MEACLPLQGGAGHLQVQLKDSPFLCVCRLLADEGWMERGGEAGQMRRAAPGLCSYR